MSVSSSIAKSEKQFKIFWKQKFTLKLTLKREALLKETSP